MKALETELPDRPAPETWRFQFGLASLFQTMFLCSVMAGIYGGMIRSVTRHDPFSTVIFLGLSLTAPMGLMMLFSGLESLRRWRQPR